MKQLKLTQKQFPIIFLLAFLLQSQYELSSIMALTPVLVLWVTFKALLIIYSLGILLHHTFSYSEGKPVGLLQSAEAVLRRMHHVLLAILLFTLLPLVLSGLGLLAVHGGSDRVLGLLVFMTIAVALVYYSTRYIFVLPAIVCRDETAIEAYSTSWQMTDQHWLKTFGLYAVLILMYFALGAQTLHTQYLLVHRVQGLFALVLVTAVLPVFTSWWARLFLEFEKEIIEE